VAGNWLSGGVKLEIRIGNIEQPVPVLWREVNHFSWSVDHGVIGELVAGSVNQHMVMVTSVWTLTVGQLVGTRTG